MTMFPHLLFTNFVPFSCILMYYIHLSFPLCSCPALPSPTQTTDSTQHITSHHIWNLFGAHFGGDGVCFLAKPSWSEAVWLGCQPPTKFCEKAVVLFCWINRSSVVVTRPRQPVGSMTPTHENRQEKGIKDSVDLFTSDPLKGGAKKRELAKFVV